MQKRLAPIMMSIGSELMGSIGKFESGDMFPMVRGIYLIR